MKQDKFYSCLVLKGHMDPLKCQFGKVLIYYLCEMQSIVYHIPRTKYIFFAFNLLCKIAQFKIATGMHVNWIKVIKIVSYSF